MVIDSGNKSQGLPDTAVPTSSNRSLAGHKLLFLTPDPIPEAYISKLHARFRDLEVVVRATPWASKLPGEEWREEDWKDVTILLSGNAFPKSREEAPKLEYVQLLSAGANMILKHPLFLDSDVAFCTANGIAGPQISEWVVATFLAFQHEIPRYLDLQREGKWKRLNFAIEDSVGKRVGILGYGAIGRQVARVFKAMGSDIHAYTLHPRNTPESRRDHGFTLPGLGDLEGNLPSKWFSGESKEELHSFLSSDLDLLVISLPLTDKTHHLLSAPEFEVMSKKRTFISNIARGAIINTADLIEALDKGVVRGAALDVTDPEPLTEGHPLWKTKNMIITPHVSGGSTAYNERMLAVLEYNLERLSEGKELINKVSRKDGY